MRGPGALCPSRLAEREGHRGKHVSKQPGPSIFHGTMTTATYSAGDARAVRPGWLGGPLSGRVRAASQGHHPHGLYTSPRLGFSTFFFSKENGAPRGACGTAVHFPVQESHLRAYEDAFLQCARQLGSATTSAASVPLPKVRVLLKARSLFCRPAFCSRPRLSGGPRITRCMVCQQPAAPSDLLPPAPSNPRCCKGAGGRRACRGAGAVAVPPGCQGPLGRHVSRVPPCAGRAPGGPQGPDRVPQDPVRSPAVPDGHDRARGRQLQPRPAAGGPELCRGKKEVDSVCLPFTDSAAPGHAKAAAGRAELRLPAYST